ncbi:MAG: type IX secretion system outer membrane channel protein PorV [Saprospiraceae bacterium]|nr:type IX secretion system outer membrane channel protein PorV [Saprospiraceae bacterium]
MSIYKLSIVSLFTILPLLTNAQFWDPIKNCVVDNNGICVSNTLLTALPFLRITPDARSGAMGDVGVALTPDANTLHFNPASMAFVKDKAAASITYTPWLRNLNLDDIFLLYMSGYTKLDDFQTLSAGIRYFSLGDIEFTDAQGGSLGTGRPREAEFAVSYARKLGDNFSAGLTGKYVFSNLATGFQVMGADISTAQAFAVDFGLNYRTKTTMGGYKGEWSFGVAMTNIGSKVSYIRDNIVKDFIPANFGLGTALTLDFDQYNSLTMAFDINKLMVPTPIAQFQVGEDGEPVPNPEWDKDNNGVPDYREKALFSGILGSFGDAQGGFREEMKELTFGLGLEYWYDKQFAFRTGYYYESSEKGNRKFFTVGAGIKYNIFGINLSYLVPTSIIPNPLDNTLRFSLLFDFAIFRADQE